MRHRLRRWWDLPTLWPICFSVLFGQDVADIDFERPFELFSLLETFSNCKIVYPNVLPVITAMLQHGLKDVLHSQDDPDSPLNDRGNRQNLEPNLNVPASSSRRRSMSLTKELESRRKSLQIIHTSLYTNSTQKYPSPEENVSEDRPQSSILSFVSLPIYTRNLPTSETLPSHPTILDSYSLFCFQ